MGKINIYSCTIYVISYVVLLLWNFFCLIKHYSYKYILSWLSNLCFEAGILKLKCLTLTALKRGLFFVLTVQQEKLEKNRKHNCWVYFLWMETERKLILVLTFTQSETLWCFQKDIYHGWLQLVLSCRLMGFFLPQIKILCPSTVQKKGFYTAQTC